jgi:teichuronic acid exporter
MQSLKTKTINGLIWNTIDKFAVQGIGFGIGIVLARILMPSDYGLIGMLAIFIAISQLMIEGGFSSALIQKHKPTNVDYSTIFYFNFIVAAIFYLILFLTAPLIASFYEVPQLTLITRVVSLSILINALSIVQQTRLTISLDFKTQTQVSLFGVVISGVLGIVAAYQGCGVWALVIQNLSSAFVRMLFLFYYNKWIPKFLFSVSSFKKLFKFSSYLLVATFISTFIQNVYSIIIGKVFAAKDLGFYSNAKQYPELLSATISNVLLGVTYPVLVSLQHERDKMVMVYGRLMRVTVFFVMPMLTLFALLSEPFIKFVLTDKWMPIAPLISWMCFARLIVPISTLNMNILNAIGRSDLFLKVNLSKLPLTIGALLITVPFGLKAVVIGHFATSFIAFFINAYYPGKLFGFGAIRQLREMKTVVIATLIMAACVYGIIQFISTDFLKLLIGGLIGIVVYVIAAFIMKIEELKDINDLIQSILLNKNKTPEPENFQME